MRIAVPIANRRLCMHFGRCEVFAFFDVDEHENIIRDRKEVSAPAHEPEILPIWIKEQGAKIVLAGGMGQKAQELFKEIGVNIVIDVIENNPAQAVLSYLRGNLKIGLNACDH